MNLLFILQPSPTKVCHIPMTCRGANVVKIEPYTVVSKEIKLE